MSAGAGARVRPCLLALVCVVLGLLGAPGSVSTDSAPPRIPIPVGYLTIIKGEYPDRQGLAISGAISFAIDEINNRTDILPNIELELKWNDTMGDTVLATRAMTNMMCDGVLAFFGPEGPCLTESIISEARNLPMIAYKCSDHKPSKTPTFARTEPPDTQVTKSVIKLLKYFNWGKFSIIYENTWRTVALSLENHAKKNNMTVNNFRETLDPYSCCDKKLICCNSEYYHNLIYETKNMTRIYVFFGSAKFLIEIMDAMQTLGLFEKNEFMVIYVDTLPYSEKEAIKYLWKPGTQVVCDTPNFQKRAKSLIVVVSSPPASSYENFLENVRLYNQRPPFSFQSPSVNWAYRKFVSIYAAYLYDGVMAYAKALHELVLNETDPDRIIEIASNGTKIIKTLSNRTYTSITGATIKLDEFGDSEGNYTVLKLLPLNDQEKDNNSCQQRMKPIGMFHGDTLVYKPIQGLNIWTDGKPNAEPMCGFMNELCDKAETSVISLVFVGVLGALLFCTSVITVSIYRKWKIEQEIEGLLWKIDVSEMQSVNKDAKAISKISLVSAGSFESRCAAQIFATTFIYRGNTVRVKELKFSKKKDIPREIMKEMRLLRELSHDNINSFIGACIEPIRILIVTDYCAKGSLYDIIENEDMKLDSMFIASLVHDLIKGMTFLHQSLLGWHGNLKSSNCVVTSRWMLQITDFGLHELRQSAENEMGEHQYYRSLFWKAPEILRASEKSPIAYGSQKADVYAFSIILYEIIGRKGPFGPTSYEPKEIINLLKRYPGPNESVFRPNINALMPDMAEESVVNCMRDCWSEDPDCRPDFQVIRIRLKKMKGRKNYDIMDQMMSMMEKYATNLEELVNERTRLLYEEKQKTEDLLHRMLPQPVAKRLTTGHGVEPESFDSVTIYFSDIVGFTSMSAESTPLEVVNFLNDLYTVFDRIIKGYDVYKVETIGDAYMVVSGLPLRNGDKHAGEIASMSLDLLSAVKNHRISHRPNETLKLRIGIHTGPVVAGVVGLTMPRYCLFGDTVNTASRMESNGEALKIHISPQCKNALEKLDGYYMEPRGHIYVKGKGEVQTYWLEGANEKAVQRRAVDVDELPPLFCRPKRHADSIHASVIGGLNSRRQSRCMYGENDSTASFGRSSPKPDVDQLRSKKILSTIDDHDANIFPDRLRHGKTLRETQSLDMLKFESPRLRTRKKSRSLDRCNTTPAGIMNLHPIKHSSFINGNATVMGSELNDGLDLRCDTIHEAYPLLNKNNFDNPDIKHDMNNVSFPPKKWKSLETLAEGEMTSPNSRFTIRSWFTGLFNGNGIRTSHGSLRKAVPLLDRESLV